ncbi:MAG: hypothetical protein ACLGSH_05815 [Acidobacteriota bacterium]
MHPTFVRKPAFLVMAAAALGLALPALGQTIPAPSEGVLCNIQSRVDTKSAKVGDAIVAKTQAKTKLKDGTEIPYGSKLIGKVVSVQSEKDGSGMSSLAIKFDQIEMKHKPPIAIQGAVIALAPAPDASGDLPTSSTSMRSQGIQTMGNYGHSDDDNGVPNGSTMPGVGLGDHVGADGTTEMRGKDRDIKLSNGDRIRVAFL